MPFITVSMYPGRSQQQKNEFADIVTNAATNILKAKKSDIIVVFEENNRENWYFNKSE